MKLLVTQAMAQMREHDHPQLGRLVTPRHYCSLAAMASGEQSWAADNDCFQGLDMHAYDVMLDALAIVAGSHYEDGRVVDRQRGSGCLFVTVPDVVGDAKATARQWVRWQSAPRRRGLPLAFVAQDDCENGLIPPWWSFDALFIGGSTEYKLGLAVERLVREAKRHGKHVHMGRVNSEKRLRYAAEIGCDSVDGTKWVKWRDTYLNSGLRFLGALEVAPTRQRLPL